MTKTLMQALVLSKLDYCNSLLIGTRKYNLDKLQSIQNMSCLVTNDLKKYDSIPIIFRTYIDSESETELTIRYL